MKQLLLAAPKKAPEQNKEEKQEVTVSPAAAAREKKNSVFASLLFGFGRGYVKKKIKSNKKFKKEHIAANEGSFCRLSHQ